MGAMVLTVEIDVLSWRPARAEAAVRALSEALGEIEHLRFFRKDNHSVVIYNHLHGPNEEISAAIRTVAVRHPKVKIRVKQGSDLAVVLAGETGEDESRQLLEVLGERIR